MTHSLLVKVGDTIEHLSIQILRQFFIINTNSSKEVEDLVPLYVF